MPSSKKIILLITTMLLCSIGFAAQPKLPAEKKCTNELHERYFEGCAHVKKYTSLPDDIIPIIGKYAYALRTLQPGPISRPPYIFPGNLLTPSSMTVLSSEDELIVNYTIQGSTSKKRYMLRCWNFKNNTFSCVEQRGDAIALPNKDFLINSGHTVRAYNSQSKIRAEYPDWLANPIYTLAHLTNQRIAAGLCDGTLQIWSNNFREILYEDCSPTQPLDNPAESPNDFGQCSISALCQADNTSLVIGYADGRLHTFDIATQKWSAEFFTQQKTNAQNMPYSGDRIEKIRMVNKDIGAVLVQKSSSKLSVQLWNIHTFQLVDTMPEFAQGDIIDMCILPKGRIAIAVQKGIIKVYNASSCSFEDDYDIPIDDVMVQNAQHIEPLADDHIAAALTDGTIRIYKEIDCTDCEKTKNGNTRKTTIKFFKKVN